MNGVCALIRYDTRQCNRLIRDVEVLSGDRH